MKVIDTNIIVRLAVDPKQAIILENELTSVNLGFVHSTVIMESIYVLQKVYEIDKSSVCDFLLAILENELIKYDAEGLLALKIYQMENIDFVDAIVIAISVIHQAVPLSKDKKMNKVYDGYRGRTE